MASRSPALISIAWVCGAGLLGLACGSPPPAPGTAGGNPSASAIAITPIFESKRPYPHHLTYYLFELEQRGDEVTVYLDIMNGYSRFLNGVTIWITLLDRDGERYGAFQHPMGSMRPQSTDHVVVEIPGVPFRADDLEVGVQVAP